MILTDWTSANLPIEYNVYSTLDANGIRQGSLLNEDGPILSTDEFKFKAERTTPIIVEVFDASGEVLEYTLKPQISLPPESSGDGDSSSDSDSSNDSGDSSNNNSSDNSEAPVDGARRSLNRNIKEIKNSNNFTTRVSFMNIAIETIQNIETTDYSPGSTSSSG